MENNKFKVTIIIPNYNRRDDLERLLPSIANQTFRDYEVIIVDDCSPDKSTVEYIKDFIKDRKNIRLIENIDNIGFVKTCNKGISFANGDYICIINNDTEVARNFIQKNVEVMNADHSIGVLSCIIVDPHGNNWFSGGRIKAGSLINLTDDFSGVRQVDFVAGTAPFYRRKVFDTVGLLNEYFYMYHEDVEFCLRVRHKTAYKTCVFGEKLVTHFVGSALLAYKKVFYYLHRNHILIVRSYYPKYMPRVLLHSLGEIIRLLIVNFFKLHPRDFLFFSSPIIRGTIAGLVKRK